MNGITNFLLKAGPTRLFAALGVAAVIAAIFFTLVLRMGGEDKALLFSNVDMREAGEITQHLEQANIPYELRGDGTSIFVARSKVLEARMMLSADGLPSRGSVGYEIFDRPDALGQTQFQQNINRLRALEGELARTIASLDGVSSARVHLVLPEHQLFARDSDQASASIVLGLRRDALSGEQVRAIRNLVASATPGLTSNRVTILDETGRLLAAADRPERSDRRRWRRCPPSRHGRAHSLNRDQHRRRRRGRRQCARAGHRRHGLQPGQRNLGAFRSGRPRGAIDVDDRIHRQRQ